MELCMRLPRLAFLVVIASAVAAQLAAVGCTGKDGGSSTTTGSGGETGSGTTSATLTDTNTAPLDCGLHSGAPACDQCLKGIKKGCCDAAETCATTPGCTDYLACASKENANCGTDGQQEAEDFITCLALQCSAVCGLDPALTTVPGGFGSPCVNDAHCSSGYCSGLGVCTGFCSGDDDCAPLPSPTGANPNRCVITASGDAQCFVGCAAQADCDALGPHLTCREAGGAKFCTAAGDTADPPACQPASATRTCESEADCACGEQCFDTTGGSVPVTSCAYPCQGDAECVTASGGVYTKCLTTNGIGHCG
jgi:hypothetical protein